MNRECQLEQVLRKYVDDGELAGAAAAVWRDEPLGWRCLDS